MAHPDSDGAAEMLEGGHRAIATAALRLAELYAGRMQIHARLREQQARAGGDSDQQHATIAAAAHQMLQNIGDDQLRSVPNGPDGEGEKVRAEAVRDVPLEEFTHAHQQAAQELAGTGTGVAAADEDAVIRRQFEILESEAFVRAVIDDKEQWEARRIAATTPRPDPAPRRRTGRRRNLAGPHRTSGLRPLPGHPGRQRHRDSRSSAGESGEPIRIHTDRPQRRNQPGEAQLRLRRSSRCPRRHPGPQRLRPRHHRKRHDHRPGLRHRRRRSSDPRRHKTAPSSAGPESRRRAGTPNSWPVSNTERGISAQPDLPT